MVFAFRRYTTGGYDKGYIYWHYNEKYEILLCKELNKEHKEDYQTKYFDSLAETKIILPKKYCPKKEFLQLHLVEVFRK